MAKRAATAETLGSIVQDIHDELQEQEQEMAEGKQTISNLQVLFLLGRIPCPASVGRQAPQALCTGAWAVRTACNGP